MTERAELQQILEEAVARGVTPGAVLVVGEQGRDVETLAVGRTRTLPDAGAPVTASTVYDLASLTKPIATAALLMRLVSERRFDLDAPLGAYLPAVAAPARDVAAVRFVGHAGGFPAHVKFYERLWRGERAGCATAREALRAMAASTGLAYPPGTQAIYSDVGYILLGFALEAATGRRLDELVAALVTGPLGLDSIRYVDLEAAARPPAGPPGAEVAATEIDPTEGLLVGVVHDENARAAGGICGHAGLFGTAGDVAGFARAMLRSARGADLAGFDADVVRRFFTTAAAPDTTWRLGWDTPSPAPGSSTAGDLWPRDGVGHLGFTGTMLWLDPAADRHVVLLTNRVHPGRDGQGIRELRRAVMDAAVRLLDRR